MSTSEDQDDRRLDASRDQEHTLATPDRVIAGQLERFLSSYSSAISTALRPIQSLLTHPPVTTEILELGQAISRIQNALKPPLLANMFSGGLGAKIAFPEFKITSLIDGAIRMPEIDWDAIYERDKNAVCYAAKHNWFIQPETVCTFAAGIDKCNGDVDELDKLFVDSISSDLDSIRSRLCSDYPNRAPVIGEIFKLHTERRFLASVPLALAAAEGIAWDASEKSIFNIQQKRPQIAQWLTRQDSLPEFSKALLAALSEPHPMGDAKAGKLSRHKVLHGRDVNYGSELFSLQAISLLGFVGWTFSSDGLTS